MPRSLILLAAVATVLVGACGDPIPREEVRATIDDDSIRVSPGASDEGVVRIFIDNEGTQPHGLVFVRATAFDELPLKADGSVDLTKVQVADQLEPLEPGHYRIQPELFPGDLVVFCNLVTKGDDGRPVSHFAAGMRAKLRIRATNSATTAPR